jgi:hypothetical protein
MDRTTLTKPLNKLILVAANIGTMSAIGFGTCLLLR